MHRRGWWLGLERPPLATKVEVMCWEWSNKFVEGLGPNDCVVLFACTFVRKTTFQFYLSH